MLYPVELWVLESLVLRSRTVLGKACQIGFSPIVNRSRSLTRTLISKRRLESIR